MSRHRVVVRVGAVLAAGTLGVLSSVAPAPPAGAEGELGGYTGSAEAAVVRIGVYEEALPIPAVPQLDVSVGYARSTTSTGPTARALASYLWPGDTVGDGLGTLLGSEALSYPVKVASKYPASESAPAKNSAQITDGNGMSTATDGAETTAAVTGLQVGPNLLSGIGNGLCNLVMPSCKKTEIGLPLPDPLKTLVSFDTAKSTSLTRVGDKVTSAARMRAAGLEILGGLITVEGFTMDAKAVSDGVKATTSGTLAITGLTVAGKKVALEESVDLADPGAPPPASPLDLSPLGVKVDYLNRSGTASGGSGKISAEGLSITLDLGALNKQLKLGVLSDLLAPILGDIPQVGPLVTGLLKFGTKIVLTLGDVRVNATASAGYSGEDGGGGGTGDTDDDAGGGSTGTDQDPGTDAGADTGTGVPADVPDDAGLGDPGAAGEEVPAPPGDVPGADAPVQADGVTPVASPFTLPGLGQVPSLLLLAGLAVAGLLGWAFRAFGAFFLGGGSCDLGASVGLPNLREG